MRLLYICADPGIPIFGQKGSSTHVRECCRALQNLGHEITILTTNPGSPPGSPAAFKLQVVTATTGKMLGFDLRLLLNNYRLYKVAKRLIEQQKPEVIYERYSLYAVAGIKLARRFNIPHLLEVNAPLSYQNMDRLHFPMLAKKFEHWSFKHTTAIIAITLELKKRLRAWRIPEEKIFIQPIAVDEGLFDPEKAASEVVPKFKKARDVVLGYVGSLNYYHGIKTLLELARLIKAQDMNMEIIVLGGSQRKVAKYRRRIKEAALDEHIKFLGQVAYEQVPDYIKLMDIGLIPDSTPWALPTKLLEYGAMGRPVVSADYPPLREFMSNIDTSLLFPPNDVKQLFNCIMRLYNSPAYREQLGEKIRMKTLENYTWQRYADHILSIARAVKETAYLRI